MVPGVYILLSHQEEEYHSSSRKHRRLHSAAHSSKGFKALSATIHYVKVIVELEKTQTRNLTLFMVLIIRPSSALKFQCDIISINHNVSEQPFP